MCSLVLLLQVDESLLIGRLNKCVVLNSSSCEVVSLIIDPRIGEVTSWDIVDVSGFVHDMVHQSVSPGVGVVIGIVVWMWVDLSVEVDG